MPVAKVNGSFREPNINQYFDSFEMETNTKRRASMLIPTLGQYVNEDIRGLVQGQLTHSQLPATPIDIQNQIDHLTKMVEVIANRMPKQGKKGFL